MITNSTTLEYKSKTGAIPGGMRALLTIVILLLVNQGRSLVFSSDQQVYIGSNTPSRFIDIMNVCH